MTLNRVQCLEDAKRNYTIATEISLKNSVRSLEDFIKIASNELGKYKLVYEIIKEQDIRKRGMTLMILVPEIRKFKDLYSQMHYYRNKVSHDDDFSPTADEVDALLKRAYEFNSFLDDELFPNLERVDTPEDKYKMELENAKWLIDYLENIPGPFDKPAPRVHTQFRSEIKEFEDRKVRFGVDIEFLNESRIELRQFTVKVENEIKEVEESVEWAIAEMDAESRFRL